MKVGIAGTGKIVREFLNMQKDQERIEVTALVCRPQSEKTGRELAEQYGIPALYTDYETFLKEAEMDAVYLGIVNQMHAFYAEKALLAGRNVINEKPFTSTVKEAEKLVRLAREKHLFLLEAITLLHFPNYHWIQEHLKDLGKITMVQANFSQYSSRYDKYLAGEVLPAFDPAAPAVLSWVSISTTFILQQVFSACRKAFTIIRGSVLTASILPERQSWNIRIFTRFSREPRIPTARVMLLSRAKKATSRLTASRARWRS